MFNRQPAKLPFVFSSLREGGSRFSTILHNSVDTCTAIYEKTKKLRGTVPEAFLSVLMYRFDLSYVLEHSYGVLYRVHLGIVLRVVYDANGKLGYPHSESLGYG